MDIPELNIIEAGVNCLQNPSLFSGLFSVSDIGKLPQLCSIWKWGAIVLALVATFGGVIVQVQIWVLRFWKVKDKLLASSGPLTQQLIDDSDTNEDEDEGEDESCSSDDEGYNPTTLFEDREPLGYEDYTVAGLSSRRRDLQWSSRDLSLRRCRSGGNRFSWSDFVSGKNVVKLWDSFGLGLDFEDDDSDGVVSIWDLSRDQTIRSFAGEKCRVAAVSTSSPAVILSAGSNNGKTLLSLYDTRVEGQNPAVFAEWRLQLGRAVGITSGEVEKVYVKDNVTSALTVGDTRNAKLPLEFSTESDGDTWWDADAVVVADDFIRGSGM